MEKMPDLIKAAEILSQSERLAVLTGAGISAESGIPTFRGEEGLWKKYRAEDLATPEAFDRDPKLIWEWYDWRRGIFASKDPNSGHHVIAEWERVFPSLALITQNIDGLHKRAGSENIIELHGNAWKLRCTEENTITENYDVPLKENPPLCSVCGALLRPHVVWFGEALDADIIRQASLLSSTCDTMLVIGTSALVQPAASLPFSALNRGTKVIEINPASTPLTSYVDFSFRGKSGEILPVIDAELQKISPRKGD
jgi:NAD-dependent deacetylase